MKILPLLASAPPALGLLLLLQGCGADSAPNSTTPTSATMRNGYNPAGLRISTATLSRDPAGNEATTLFAPSDHTMYVNVLLSGPGNGATVRHVWTQVSDSFLPDRILCDEEAVVEDDKNATHAKATYSEDWPIGTYKTEIYLNGNLERTLNWSVR
jgi:hypothetical protein